MKIVVTGAHGLLGWHASVALHALNCAAGFKGGPAPVELVRLGRAEFSDVEKLQAALAGGDAVLHFAGVNRAPDAELEAANPLIAEALVDGCKAVGAQPHIIYANSIHAKRDTPYGRSKQRAGEVLAGFAERYTDILLPNIFGEAALPDYNNVTATLIDRILKAETPEINPDGKINLLHAGAAVQVVVSAAMNGPQGVLEPEAPVVSIPALYEKLLGFHKSYQANVFPDVSDAFDLALFNSYRAATYPDGWPRGLTLHSDARGRLFEAVKGGGGGQCFMSTTLPGVTRGDHFHLHKVERFLVVQGEAVIRIRKVLEDDVWEYKVSGDAPSPVDMPTLHTHSIENIGDTPLLTLFWTHDLFDPENPDTYADKVLP